MRRFLPVLLLLPWLPACGPKRGVQTLDELGGRVVLEVPLPSDPEGVGAAFFEARIAGLPGGKEWVTPRPGVTLLCRGRGGDRLEVRVMIEGAQIDARSGVVETSCPLGDGLPVTIRW